MSRKKNSGVVDDLVDLVSSLPWWFGCLFAALSYFILHLLAVSTANVAVHTPVALSSIILRALTTAGQYVVPGLCLLGAGNSAWRNFNRNKLISDVAQGNGAQALENISWQEFEMLVGEYFRLLRFRVLEVGGGGADGGVDLVLLKGGETHLVQCKHWKAFKVGVDVVRELYGVMAAKGAAKGYVVTSGTFTKDAKEFASGRNVTLMDGEVLVKLIAQARQSIQARSNTDRYAQSSSAPITPTAPTCPTCSKQMVERTAHHGKNAGSTFWGCVDFPTCRGTRQKA